MGKAHTAQARGKKQTDRQAGTCGAQTVRQLLAPLSQFPRDCPFWHLPSALSQEEGYQGWAREGRAAQKPKALPFSA